MTDSILDSVKQVLGLPTDYVAFDKDIVFHINAALSECVQLGMGNSQTEILDKTTVWSDFFDEDARLNMIKSYVAGRTRLLFDPPTPGYVHTAHENRLKELAWRIAVVADEIKAEEDEV